MKIKITLFLFFITFFSNAAYKSATVFMLDGTSEKGFIDSFLEDKFFDFNFFGSFETGLIYNDYTILFKLDADSERKKINIDSIDKIIIHYDGFDKEYKALFIRNLDRKGFLQENKSRIFLPLLRSGKVNIYGFYHTESSSNPGEKFPSGSTVTVREIFYYQNANENYAIDYYNIEIQDMFNLRDRFANPLKELFKDCPELVTKVDNNFYEKNLTKEEKKKLKAESKNMYKATQKEYNKLPKDQKRGDLLLFHQYNMKPFDDLLLEYENCN